MRFNTAIAALMSSINALGGDPPAPAVAELLVLLVAPFAPHVAEELWAHLGHRGSVHDQPWPE